MLNRPSPEAVAALIEQTGMGVLQAIRHLQQRAELQRRAERPHMLQRFALSDHQRTDRRFSAEP